MQSSHCLRPLFYHTKFYQFILLIFEQRWSRLISGLYLLVKMKSYRYLNMFVDLIASRCAAVIARNCRPFWMIWNNQRKRNQRYKKNVYHDITKQKRYQYYWSFVRGIQRSSVDSPHKRPVIRTYDLLVLAWTSCWTNSRVTGYLRRYGAHVTPLQCLDIVPLDRMTICWPPSLYLIHVWYLRYKNATKHE